MSKREVKPGQTWRVTEKAIDKSEASEVVGQRIVIWKRDPNGKGWVHRWHERFGSGVFVDAAFETGALEWVSDGPSTFVEVPARAPGQLWKFVGYKAISELKQLPSPPIFKLIAPVKDRVDAWWHNPIKDSRGETFRGRRLDGFDDSSLELVGEEPVTDAERKEVREFEERMSNPFSAIAALMEAAPRTPSSKIVTVGTNPPKPESNEQKELRQLRDSFNMMKNATESRYGWVVAGPFFAINAENQKDRRVVVTSGGGELVSLACPEAVAKDPRPGQRVRIDVKLATIIGVEQYFEPGGLIGTLRALKRPHCEVDFGTQTRWVVIGDNYPEAEVGGRVSTDPGMQVVQAYLGMAALRQDAPKVSVDWSEIGGQEAAKIVLKDAVCAATKNAELFKRYGRTPCKGVLLAGPPGCGKTLLAKAAATEFARLQGGEMTGFIYVKGPEILSKWVGEAERSVRDLFERARKHFTKTGQRAFIFMDEADAVLSRRGSGQSSDMERTIVPAFLAEMDGLDEGNPFILLATNRPEQLDPAIVRDGRIDQKVAVRRPSRVDAYDILRLYLGKRPVQGGVDELADAVVTSIFDGAHTLAEIHNEEHHFKLTLDRMISGAMLAGVAERAAAIAMRRDIAHEVTEPSGLCKQDLLSAVEEVAAGEKESAAFMEALIEFAIEKSLDVAKVKAQYGKTPHHGIN